MYMYIHVECMNTMNLEIDHCLSLSYKFSYHKISQYYYCKHETLQYLKVTFFTGTKLTFDISADWPKNTKFYTRNH
jgi:hypothetical protein